MDRKEELEKKIARFRDRGINGIPLTSADGIFLQVLEKEYSNIIGLENEEGRKEKIWIQDNMVAGKLKATCPKCHIMQEITPQVDTWGEEDYGVDFYTGYKLECWACGKTWHICKHWLNGGELKLLDLSQVEVLL